jgi:rhodanese-related sulfurtransferase
LALAGALRTIPDEPGNVVVVIFPDNAFKYISSFQKHLPQLFPRQEETPPAAASNDQFAAHLQAALAFAEKGPDVIDVLAANDLLSSGVPVIDVRNPDEFANGRIAQARNVPLPALSAGETKDLPSDHQAPIITICARGKRSLYGLLLLKARGYQNVKSVAGGMGAWVESGLPTESNR